MGTLDQGATGRPPARAGGGREGDDVTDTTASKAGAAARAMILPLALAQFIARAQAPL